MWKKELPKKTIYLKAHQKLFPLNIPEIWEFFM